MQLFGYRLQSLMILARYKIYCVLYFQQYFTIQTEWPPLYSFPWLSGDAIEVERVGVMKYFR